MQRTITIHIGLVSELADTIELVNRATNDILTTGFKEQTFNKLKLHHLTYYPTREKYPAIPSSLVTTARDTASEMLKRDKCRVLPHKKEHSAIRFNQRTFTPKIGKGYATFATVHGRVKVPIVIPDYFKKYADWDIVSARLSVKGQRMVLQLVVEHDTPLVRPINSILGVDVGIINYAVLSNNKFFNSAHIRAVKGKYRHNRSELQAVGTRSAKRKLKRLSGRENRFVCDTNHVVAKWIVGQPFHAIALEKLTGIRTGPSRGRRFNRMLGNWSFGQLQQFVNYNAESAGKAVIYIDARYTSQRCSRCGHTDKHNRHGLVFKCWNCGYELNADLNAAYNIARNGMTVSGRPYANRPMVTCNEGGHVSSPEHSYKPTDLSVGN